jgi:O-succinylbenzoate synthase
MKTTIVLRRVSIPFREPFRISNGVADLKDSVIVEIRRGDISGFGEAGPLTGGAYSAETAESSWERLEQKLIPFWLESEFAHPADVGPALDTIPGEPFARAALEGASWDLVGRETALPLWRMFGSQSRPIESGVAIGIFDTLDELLERVDKYLRDGYRRTKIKIQPGWDVEPIRAIRERFGNIPLMVDANTAYTLDHLDIFQELDRFNLMMFEQPFPAAALQELAELQRQVKTPLCADESAESQQALETMIELGSVKIINIKVQRVGGLTNARRMYDRAHQAGLGIWLGTMPELGVASAQGLHLATLPGFNFPTDVEASERWYEDDIVDPLITLSAGGLIRIPDGPGMGYSVNAAKLDQYTVQRMEFSS